MTRHTASSQASDTLRLDKWLWAARFYKTRGLARQAIEAGHVRVNGTTAKPSRSAHVGDRIEITRGEHSLELAIRALSHHRGPASVAIALFEETEQSIERRERAKAERTDQAHSMRPGGVRPTKRERRNLDRWRDTSPGGAD